MLDNARRQKCGIVTLLAEELGISLEYLPPYSPSLNLIERLWRFAKARLRARYYYIFEMFRDAIDSILKGVDNDFKEQVSRLIGDKIQLFDGLEEVCENTYATPMHAKKPVNIIWQLISLTSLNERIRQTVVPDIVCTLHIKEFPQG